jgi:uncharacterized membrane protein YqhA
VVALLVCALAVFVFGGVTTISSIVTVFGEGEFNAEGARLLSTEMIELIDLFLLGTILLITAVGLYELFLDPDVPLPGWMSVQNLDQLKMNLLAVIVVMLAVLFLGAAAGEWHEGQSIMEYGIGIALVIAAASFAVFIFQHVHKTMHHSHEPVPLPIQAEHDDHHQGK